VFCLSAFPEASQASFLRSNRVITLLPAPAEYILHYAESLQSRPVWPAIRQRRKRRQQRLTTRTAVTAPTTNDTDGSQADGLASLLSRQHRAEAEGSSPVRRRTGHTPALLQASRRVLRMYPIAPRHRRCSLGAGCGPHTPRPSRPGSRPPQAAR